MFSKTFSTAAAVLAVAQLASAQTYTECNPTEKTCPADEAFGSTVDVDFTKGKNENFYEFDGTKIDYTDEGAVFTINKESDAPTIGTNKYIFFGKVDVTVQASFGQGVVTSFVLQSDDLDEIDWEWLGGDTTQVQTNYFGKGDTTTYDRGAYHDVANPQTSTHTYTVDWTKDYVRWSIDGTQVRELTYAEAKEGTRFPQTPMQIRLGTWVAGRADAPKGTVEWAGGYTDFSKAPFIAYYKEIKITDYSNGVDGASKYVWDDGSDGSYQSIQVVTGDDSDDDTSSTSSAKPTSTTSAKPSSTAESSKTSSEASETTASATVSKTASATVTSASATATVSASASTTATSTGGESASETSGDSTSETDAAPSSTDIPQTAAAFKAGSSAIAMAAGLLIAALF